MPFVASYLFVEYDRHKNIHVLSVDMKNEAYLIPSRFDNLLYTSTNCTCVFFKAWLSTCRHVFHIRYLDKLSVFDKSLCAERWFKKPVKTKLDTCNQKMPKQNKPYSPNSLGNPNALFKNISSTLMDCVKIGFKFLETCNALKEEGLNNMYHVWTSGEEFIVTVSASHEKNDEQ